MTDTAQGEGASREPGSERRRTLPGTDNLKRLKRESASVYFNGALRRGGEISANLKVVTPILGGSYKLRHIDDIDIVRAQSVRPSLRFWWRALYAQQFPSAEKLYEEESKLWGRAADGKGGRSAVEVRATVIAEGDLDGEDVTLYGRSETPGAYALWPAKAQRADRRRNRPQIDAAPRRIGTHFRLTIIGPEDSQPTLRNVLRAWILFGGYGSRTRRGLGSLTVEGDRALWLPTTDLKAPNGARLNLDKALRASLQTLFSADIFAQAGGIHETPTLAGAALHVVSPPMADAQEAWTTALGWLREFRQGPPGGRNGSARQPGRGRPGISNWPEADKMRHHMPVPAGHVWPHPPTRHNPVAALPRAGFGLPIVGRFNTPGDPGDFEIAWSTGTDGKNRLASPLVLKALPLADGRFVPCALWLNRALPKGAKVSVRGVPATECDFDILEAPGDPAKGIAADVAQFPALRGHSTLQAAFHTWLATAKQAKRVAQ